MPSYTPGPRHVTTTGEHHYIETSTRSAAIAVIRRHAYLRGRIDKQAGRGLYYSGPYASEYMRGAREAKS